MTGHARNLQGDAGDAVTAWNYSTSTGRLLSKRYNSNNAGGTGLGPEYTYTDAGRLATRTWASNVSTTYYYDSGGRRLAIDYSVSTPDVLYDLDVLGRIVTEFQGTLDVSGAPSMTSPVRSVTHTHDSATLLPESETHDLGGLTRTILRDFDSSGRPQRVDAGIDTDSDPSTLETTEHFTDYHYGTDGRLLGVHGKDLPTLAGKTHAIEYGYVLN